MKELRGVFFFFLFLFFNSFCFFGQEKIKDPYFYKEQIPTISIPAPSSGSINIQMDDPGIYAQTKLIKLVNLKASEIEPFVKKDCHDLVRCR